MRAVNGKIVALAICVASLALFSGCTDWQKKYEYLDVEHQNLKGRYERLLAEKDQLAGKISQDQQTIEELRRQIDQMNKTPAEATGFGKDYDVKFDPSAGTITVTLPDAILFASGQASLKSATSAPLDHILSVLRQKYAGKHIDVVGHTDSDPIKKSPWRDNWQLSAERALAVTKYLIDHGISPDRVRAVGCGEARPIASNATAAGKAKNRRVEIVVHIK